MTRRWRLKRPRQQGHFYPLSRLLGLSALILAFVSFGAVAHPGDEKMSCSWKQEFVCQTHVQKVREDRPPDCKHYTRPLPFEFSMNRINESPLTYDGVYYPGWPFFHKQILQLRSTDDDDLSQLTDRHFIATDNTRGGGMFDEESAVWATMTFTGHPHKLTLVNIKNGRGNTTITTLFAFCMDG